MFVLVMVDGKNLFFNSPIIIIHIFSLFKSILKDKNYDLKHVKSGLINMQTGINTSKVIISLCKFVLSFYYLIYYTFF